MQKLFLPKSSNLLLTHRIENFVTLASKDMKKNFYILMLYAYLARIFWFLILRSTHKAPGSQYLLKCLRTLLSRNPLRANSILTMYEIFMALYRSLMRSQPSKPLNLFSTTTAWSKLTITPGICVNLLMNGALSWGLSEKCAHTNKGRVTPTTKGR